MLKQIAAALGPRRRQLRLETASHRRLRLQRLLCQIVIADRSLGAGERHPKLVLIVSQCGSREWVVSVLRCEHGAVLERLLQLVEAVVGEGVVRIHTQGELQALVGHVLRLRDAILLLIGVPHLRRGELAVLLLVKHKHGCLLLLLLLSFVLKAVIPNHGGQRGRHLDQAVTLSILRLLLKRGFSLIRVSNVLFAAVRRVVSDIDERVVACTSL